jgi:hypothetical protein
MHVKNAKKVLGVWKTSTVMEVQNMVNRYNDDDENEI